MNKNIVVQNLGSGIVCFKNAVSIDNFKFIDYIKNLKEKAIKEDYNIVYDDSNNPLYAINRSGHRYTIEEVNKSSSHIMNFIDSNTDDNIVQLFTSCEQAMYDCAILYADIYPMILPSLWWRMQGHVLAYGPGSLMGLHSDNDVNYQPGFEPDLQVATRNVVGSIIYLNSSVESENLLDGKNYVGGEISFPYANIVYRPQAGDLLMFPSNYLGTHEVLQCKAGERYAYIGYYCHGSEDPSRGINISHEEIPVGLQGQIWLKDLVKDYINFINEKYSGDQEKIEEKLFPTYRLHNSANTMKEIHND
jgi:hypothetical protein